MEAVAGAMAGRFGAAGAGARQRRLDLRNGLHPFRFANTDRPTRRVGVIVDEGGEPKLQTFTGNGSSGGNSLNGADGEHVISDDDDGRFDTPAFLRNKLAE